MSYICFRWVLCRMKKKMSAEQKYSSTKIFFYNLQWYLKSSEGNSNDWKITLRMINMLLLMAFHFLFNPYIFKWCDCQGDIRIATLSCKAPWREAYFMVVVLERNACSLHIHVTMSILDYVNKHARAGCMQFDLLIEYIDQTPVS